MDIEHSCPHSKHYTCSAFHPLFITYSDGVLVARGLPLWSEGRGCETTIREQGAVHTQRWVLCRWLLWSIRKEFLVVHNVCCVVVCSRVTIGGPHCCTLYRNLYNGLKSFNRGEETCGSSALQGLWVSPIDSDVWALYSDYTGKCFTQQSSKPDGLETVQLQL